MSKDLSNEGKVLSHLKKLLVVYFLLVIMMVSLRVGSNLLPVEKIRENVRQSAVELEKYGGYPIFGWKAHEWDPSSQIDVYTEKLLLSNQLLVDNEHPIRDMFLNPMTHMDPDDFSYFFEEDINKIPVLLKPQYWWGMQSVSRFMLYFMNFSKMMGLLQLIFLLLFLRLGFLVYKEFGKSVFIAFVVSLWSAKFYEATFITETIYPFIIMCISSVYIIENYKKNKSIEKVSLIIFITGACTGHFDWMSTPVLTCTFAILFALLITNKEDKVGFVKNFRNLIVWGLHWTSGYLLILATKWGLVALFTDFNIADIALERITSNVDGYIEWAPKNKIDFYIDALKSPFRLLRPFEMGWGNLLVALLILSVISIIYALYTKGKHADLFLNLLFASIIPIGWIMVVKKHSYIHFWYVYRSLSATMFAWISIIILTLKNEDNFLKKIVSLNLREKLDLKK